MSNRKSRRTQPKEIQRNNKAINSLTLEQARVANLVADERGKMIANQYISNFEKLIDRNMSAALIDYGIDYNDIAGIQKNMSELMIEDSKKSKRLEEGNINMADIENKVLAEVKDLLEKEVSKKESIERLIYKFPKLSRSMLVNAYVKVKKEMGLIENRISRDVVYAELDRYADKLESKDSISKLMNKFDFTESTAKTYYSKWKKDYMSGKPINTPKVTSVPTIEKATSEELQENASKIIEAAKEGQCQEPVSDLVQVAAIIKEKEVEEVKGLKIIEEKVIKTIKVEGQNGLYEADTLKGVILSRDNASISFKNEEQLNEWVSEVRTVLQMVI